jgi:hypothetical protein
MAATKRQRSRDPAERKRGKYKAAGVAAPPFATVSRETWQAWVDEYTEGSPLEHEPTRRGLAEGLATARRIVTEFAERPPMTLTDGEARLLAKALKELRDTTRALALDRIDKARRKRARTDTTKETHATNSGRTGAMAPRKLDGEGRKPMEPRGPRVGAEGNPPATVRMEDLLAGR